MRVSAFLAGLLAVLFSALSGIVAAGGLRVSDRQVAILFARLYDSSWLPFFQVLAVLGGAELTLLLAVGLFLYLRGQGYRLGAWAAAAVPLATAAELVYKRLIDQPGPPATISHPDGWSLSTMLEGAPGLGWSFPSGHMVRSVVIYGLIAFVVFRLAEQTWARRLAPLAALLLVVAMAFDRLYLAVHWESDVIGGILLGGVFLAASISWLEWSAARSR